MSDRRIEPDDDIRTRARERAYREFMAPGDPPDAREAAKAEERLQSVLEREIGVPLGRREPVRGGLFDFLRTPAWRPAFAALLLVVAGTWFTTSVLRRKEPPVMRGPGSVLQEGEIALSAPEKGPGGSLALHWSAAPEAERYAVVFVSPDLTEIARVEDLAEPSLDLSGASLPPGLDPGSDVLYRVVAMRGGDEIARSRTVAITLPGR